MNQSAQPQFSTRTFVVHAMQTGLLTQTYSMNSSTICLMPTQPLKTGELVQASATTGTLSLGGVGPISPTVWQFWTEVLGGSGLFEDSEQTLGSSNSVVAVLGDVDGDGDLDAFVANCGQANKVWLNDGTGTFSDSGQNLGSSLSESVALGDVDGDGDLDAFVGNVSTQANKVWLNDGTGIFADSGQSLGSSYSVAVALGDVDGDGDLDAFVGNWAGQADEVWLNDGTGIFADSGQRLGNSSGLAVALGDVDGDGDLDAFVANGLSQANKVWLNQSPPTAIELISFTAKPLPRGRVLLAWETGTEVDNAGFNLYRTTAEEGPYTKIAGLIPAKGSPVAGARYRFLDKPGFGRFFYKLEDVDIYGGSTMHGPVEAVVLPRPGQ